MSSPVVSVVYVSWRDTDVLTRSLEQLVKVAATDRAFEVIVVINEAGEGAVEPVRAASPHATVVANVENRGFGPACNQGAMAASGDILLFLNPDTLPEDCAIDEVRRGFAERPDAVAVAPRLVGTGPGGEEAQREFQFRRLPTLGADGRELLLVDRALPANRLHRRDRYLDVDRDRPMEVEQAAAAALAIRRESFEAIGGFDERFRPAYWEDVDLCFRLRERGPIVYWPSARFAHIGGVSANALGARRFRRMYYTNALRYREKHYRAAALVAYRGLLVVGMAMRAMVVLLTSRPGPGTSHELRGFLDVVGLAVRGVDGGGR